MTIITLTPPMNPEIKTAWTAGLRSGDFEQGTQWLRSSDKYCCLGVLCVQAGEARIIEAGPADGYYEDEYYDEKYPHEPYGGTWVPDFNGRWDFGQDDETLPDAVQSWAGLHGSGASNPLVRVPGEIIPRLNEHARALLGYASGEEVTVTLAQLNDAKVPFPVIADIIDACL